MQIFPQLQRNGSDKILVRLLLIYFVNFFSSFTPFFPIMLGVFLFCENFFMALLFIVLFSLFHNFNLLFFSMLMLFIKFVLLERLKDIVDFHYQDAVALFIVYLALGIYLRNFANIETSMLFIYLIYNYAFDLIAIRLLKCELKSY